MKKFKVLFVPHLPAIELEVTAKSGRDAVTVVKRQIKKKRGPAYDEVHEKLYKQLLAGSQGRPSLCPCPGPNVILRRD